MELFYYSLFISNTCNKTKSAAYISRGKTKIVYAYSIEKQGYANTLIVP